MIPYTEGNMIGQKTDWRLGVIERKGCLQRGSMCFGGYGTVLCPDYVMVT